MKDNIDLRLNTSHKEIVKDVFKGFFWGSGSILIFLSVYYFTIIEDLIQLSVKELFFVVCIIFIPYLVVTILAINKIIFNFYSTIFVLFVISIENITAAWCLWYQHLPLSWFWGGLILTPLSLLFWYFITKKKYCKKLLVNACIDLKIIDLEKGTATYKSLRESLYQNKSSIKQKVESSKSIFHSIVEQPFVFPALLVFFLFLGRSGYKDIQMLLLSFVSFICGYFIIVYLILMREMPLIKQLKIIEKLNGIRLKNI